MKCKDIQNKLNAYLDNEVDSKLKRSIESHLLSCHECQTSLSELKALNYQLDIHFEQEINPQIISELIDKSRFIRPQKKNIAQFVLTAATMGIAVFLGAYISNVSFDKSPSVTTAVNTTSTSTSTTTTYYDQQSLYAVLEEVSQ